MKRFFAAILLFSVFGSAHGQTPPEPTPTPPPASETAPASSDSLLDQIGDCVETGKLGLEIDLLAGRVPAAPRWAVEVRGAPVARMTTQAAGGHIQHFEASVGNGELVVVGSGLRPKVAVEALTFEDGKGITAARFHGKGIWKPIVAIFRGVAMSALSKLEFRTDIRSVLRGDLLVSKSSAGTPAPTPTPSAGEAAAGPSFLDLVREVRVRDSELVAFPGKPLAFGEVAQFRTATGAAAKLPLRVSVDKASFRPSHGEAASHLDVEGRLEGQIENGAVGFVGSRSTFSHGELRGGSFRVRSAESGGLETQFSAVFFGVDLTSGRFRVPGGPEVDVEAPSRFSVRDLRVHPDATYSGSLDAELVGKVGAIVRSGSRLSASDMHLRTEGLRVVNGRVTGEIALEFDYRLDYPLVVHYPVKEIGERRVPLLFRGPFQTTLRLENAGSGEEGTVTGEYSFKVPWPPVEQAALEVLRARWTQDVAAVVRKVNFDIEPRRFGPCGGTCFLLSLDVTAEKKSSDKKRSLFRQLCHPEGKADLVVDAASRSFVLKNVRIEPKCKGVVGWVVNFLSPFLTKSYTDVTLFQMPENLPFTIDKVGSGVNYLAISGRVAWAAGAPAIPPAQPSQ